MIRSLVNLFAVVALCVCCGCIEDKMVAPVEPLIEKGANDDFGLEGEWVEHLDPHKYPFDNPETRIFQVARDPLRKDLYLVKSREPLNPRFRVVKCRDDSAQLIVDMEYQWDGETNRCIGLAYCEGDKLHVSWFVSTNLIKSLCEDKHFAVLEHTPYTTRVHADSAELLETLRHHEQELRGPSRTFVRVKSARKTGTSTETAAP